MFLKPCNGISTANLNWSSQDFRTINNMFLFPVHLRGNGIQRRVNWHLAPKNWWSEDEIFPHYSLLVSGRVTKIFFHIFKGKPCKNPLIWWPLDPEKTNIFFRFSPLQLFVGERTNSVEVGGRCHLNHGTLCIDDTFKIDTKCKKHN